MCGIAGIVRFTERPVDADALIAMRDVMTHRGPDDCGLYLEPWVGLAHRRLSIIDLSPAGHQPMCNEDGTIWVVFNGEIYNFEPLRRELAAKGHRFLSGTDTEVILHAYEEWGERCLDRFNGMWAFAVWDQRRQELFCARDRSGVKPFYYYADENFLVFASEIKGLLAHSHVPRQLNRASLYRLLKFGLMDTGTETCFEGIRTGRPHRDSAVLAAARHGSCPDRGNG
jgi:asparagine synthase (glutamine-hydrolysing)